ncbi:MAG: hypothetical protein ABIB46_00650 [bacterium]
MNKIIFIFLIVFYFTIPIFAEEEKSSESKTKSKEIVMEEIEIVGKIEKPQAIYIIPKAKSELELEDVDLSKSFIDDIIEPLDPLNN